jgi:long-chain acyl-CoA synthetase
MATSEISETLARIRASLTAPGAAFEVGPEDVRGTVMPVFRHRARSLREVLDRSARFGDRTYLVDGDVRLDFASHLRLVDALAAGLQRVRAVRPGDRIAIFAANRWDWAVAFWAVISAGGIPCAFNGWWTPEEFAHAADLVDPALVIGDGPRLARVAESGVAIPVLDLDAGVAALLRDHDGEVPDTPAASEDDPAVLIFTSGTTGRPKAVTVPHRAVCGFAHVSVFAEAVGLVASGAPPPGVGDGPPASDDVVLVTSPLFHVSMLWGAVLMAAVRGSCFVLLPGRFDPERVLRAIDRERVTMWMALGSAAPRVSASPAVGRYDTSSLRYVAIGGATVSPAVQQGLRETFPSASSSVGMAYTSTEAGAVVASIRDPEFSAHPTSTGRITTTVAVELRDELGRPVGEGELGEVHVRSPYVMLGYWADPEASAAVLKDDGWLAMGDMARMQDGLLYIDARARDMILVSAENVSPTEVEYCLEAHPQVIEAAVLAVDDPVTGDAVCAAVVVEPGTGASSESLAAWCRASLAHYKVPTRWHLVEDPLPRTASGKLMKHRIRELLLDASSQAPRPG